MDKGINGNLQSLSLASNMAIADAAKHVNFQFNNAGSTMLYPRHHRLKKKKRNIQRRQHSVPRCLRWDVPPNDGLMDDESIKECEEFFTKKGLEIIDFLAAEDEVA